MVWLQVKRLLVVLVICYLMLVVVSLPDTIFNYFGY